VAPDVRIARSNARALPDVGCRRQRRGARRQPEIERGPLHHSAMSTAMIVHVMLVDKKLETTLHVVDMLHGVRPYASGLLLALCGSLSVDSVSTRVSRIPATTETSPRQKKCLLCHSTGALKKSKLTDASKVRLMLSFHQKFRIRPSTPTDSLERLTYALASLSSDSSCQGMS